MIDPPCAKSPGCQRSQARESAPYCVGHCCAHGGCRMPRLPGDTDCVIHQESPIQSARRSWRMFWYWRREKRRWATHKPDGGGAPGSAHARRERSA